MLPPRPLPWVPVPEGVASEGWGSAFVSCGPRWTQGVMEPPPRGHPCLLPLPPALGCRGPCFKQVAAWGGVLPSLARPPHPRPW